MNETKPIFVQRTVNHCPVCKEATYSAGGIHPQCAVKLADEPRRLALVATAKQKKADRESIVESTVAESRQG